MAQDDNFVILDEELHEEEELKKSSFDEEKPKERSTKKIILYIIIAFLILSIIIFITLFFLYLDKKEQTKERLKTQEIIKDIQTKQKQPKPDITKTQQLLLKASKLQNLGKKEEALKIYEKISLTNKALSFYNIAVAKMRDKKYKEAIKSFQNSIDYDNSYKCPSAINIAICALKLNDRALFNKYIKLASEYLSFHTNSPLYSYYLSLINYYQFLYPETLVSLKHQSSNFYQNEQNLLSAKIALALQNEHLAIDFLQKDKRSNSLALGLLYARIKEYDIAQKYLLKAINDAHFPIRSKIALSLVYLKNGLFNQASINLKDAYEQFKDKALDIYPIKVSLKKSLFDPVVAQKEFKKSLFFDDERKIALIYYFSPFKFSNLKQSMLYIDKGAKNVSIDENRVALEFLNRSKNISEVNILIAKGIKKTYDGKLYKAKEIFLKALKKYPSHSILHYNLALVYAKTDDYKSAHKHFLKSYRLDPNNFQAGIYSYMSAKILHIDETKLLDSINEKVLKNQNLDQRELLLSIISVINGQNDALSLKEFQKDPLKIILQILKSSDDNYKLYATKLKKSLPKDLVTHIIYLDALNHDKSLKEYAKAIQKSFIEERLDYNSLFYGSALSKKLFVQILNIAGITYKARELLSKKLEDEDQDSIGLLQALAYTNIYTKNFEDAYILYNELIDTHKQKDSKTIFFAAVASIGADHHENAIALLELSKLIDPSNNESRHALGLLYHEAKNFKGASIQYAKIGDSNFESEYFTFDIKK